jgi:hypothetical protein
MIEELDALTDMLKNYKKELIMPTKKTRGANYGLADVSTEALEHAINFYKDDYNLFKDYYNPEKLRMEHKEAFAG